jgi:hypothetical protein
MQCQRDAGRDCMAAAEWASAEGARRLLRGAYSAMHDTGDSGTRGGMMMQIPAALLAFIGQIP